MAQDDLILHPKKLQGEDGFRVFSVRLPVKTVQRLESLALQSNRSRNELINILLEYALDRCVIREEDSQQ